MASQENAKRSVAAWKARNPDRVRARRALDKAEKIRATPQWLSEEDLEAMVEMYKLARLTGTQVDHMVPLRGKTVCGLHVPWNLQLLTPVQNRLKSNKI